MKRLSFGSSVKIGLVSTAMLLAGCQSAADETTTASASSKPPKGTPKPPATPVDLSGTQWRLVEIQSMDDAQGTKAAPDPAKYTVAFGADGQAAYRLDCNRGTGTWKATSSPDGKGGTLTFGPIASTRALCGPPSLGEELARQMPNVRSFTIAGGKLNMALMADGGIIAWEPDPNAR